MVSFECRRDILTKNCLAAKDQECDEQGEKEAVLQVQGSGFI
jgi:hypothetical protein